MISWGYLHALQTNCPFLWKPKSGVWSLLREAIPTCLAFATNTTPVFLYLFTLSPPSVGAASRVLQSLFFFMPNKPVSITTSKTVLLVDQLLSVGCSNSFKPRARTALASTASFPKRLCSFPWWLLHVSTWASTSHSSLVALHPSLPVAFKRQP